MGRPCHKSIFHQKNNQGWVQGYMYLAFQPQGNGQQNLTLKNSHYNKHQQPWKWLRGYTLDEETDHNQSQLWREEFVIAKNFHTVETSVHQTTPQDHLTNMLEFDQSYYVNMLQSLIVIEE